jgi:hypothetical protein
MLLVSYAIACAGHLGLLGGCQQSVLRQQRVAYPGVVGMAGGLHCYLDSFSRQSACLLQPRHQERTLGGLFRAVSASHPPIHLFIRTCLQRLPLYTFTQPSISSLAQIPRLYNVYKETGVIENFQQV